MCRWWFFSKIDHSACVSNVLQCVNPYAFIRKRLQTTTPVLLQFRSPLLQFRSPPVWNEQAQLTHCRVLRFICSSHLPMFNSSFSFPFARTHAHACERRALTHAHYVHSTTHKMTQRQSFVVEEGFRTERIFLFWHVVYF